MPKKLFFFSFLFLILLGFLYPTKKENTGLFDYCYCLENILSRNTIERRGNISKKVRSVAKDFAKLGIGKTKGVFINRMIDEYKTSKNFFIISMVPNRFYCLAGYWVENLNPGRFESIIFEKSNQKINEFKDIKDEVDGFIKGINSEYKILKKELDSFF